MDLEPAGGEPLDDVAMLARARAAARRGALDEAVTWLQQAASRQPSDPALHAELGLALRQAGRLDAALASYDRALALAPDAVQVLAFRANLLNQLRRPGEALASAARALGLRPDHALALNAKGMAEVALRRPAEAAASFRAALTAEPLYEEARFNLARLLMDQGDNAGAEAVFDEALALRPDWFAALMGRGQVLARQERHVEALESLAAAQRLNPEAGWELDAALGMSLTALGRHEAALEAFGRAIARAPEAHLAFERRAQVRLGLKDFAGGWADYEHRWRSDVFLPRSGAALYPRGAMARLTLDPRPESFIGRRVLVLGEQGVGDQVMFASCLPDLVGLAERVVVAVDPRLTRLFAVSFPGIETLGFPEAADLAPEEFDRVAAIGSLPAAFRRREADFPGTAYLRPSPEAQVRWRVRTATPTGVLRVGLAWRGGTRETRQALRSIPLERLAPILATPNCAFFSLQYGDVGAEVEAVNRTFGAQVRLFPQSETDDFDDLAALTASLDVVVTVQQSAAHLAGALGVRALVMVPKIAEWRYTAAGPAMPWYRAVELLREGEAGWPAVIERAAELVGEMARSNGRRVGVEVDRPHA